MLADRPDRQVSLRFQPGRDAAVSAVAEPLTSRAANNLFWVGRYLERIKASTRLIRTILLKLAENKEFDDPLGNRCLNVLLCAITQVTGTHPGFALDNGPLEHLIAVSSASIRA